MASTELQKRKQEEYEMQLFDFHSRAVFATLKNVVYDQIKYKCRKLCETIKEKHKPDAESLDILKENERQLLMAYHRGAVPHVQTIENIVNKYICIPPNVLLKEDTLQKVQYTEEEFNNIKRKLKELQHKAKQATIFNAALQEEMKMIEQFESQENQLNKMISIMETGLMIPEPDSKMIQLVQTYKKFTLELGVPSSPSLKFKYNNLDNLKCKDCDLDS